MEKEKLDQLTEKVGGRERLTLVLQRRLKELAAGDAPRIDPAPSDLVEVALREAFDGKIDLNVTIPAPPREVPPSYESGGRPSPMMRPPRPGPRPGGPRRQGYTASSRPGGGMRRPGPPRRGPQGGGGGGNRGGGRWPGPR